MPAATLDGLVAATAERHPTAIAVVDGDDNVTYEELHRRAALTAASLHDVGVGLDDVVAVMLTTSVDQVAALLGALYAGAAFLCIDPAHGDAHNERVLEHAGVAAVVGAAGDRTGTADRLGRPVLHVDARAAPRRRGPARSRPESLAYVVYTSGSTGAPKGVAVPHAGIVDHLTWRNADVGLRPGDVVLQTFSPAFDPFVWDVFAPLAAGATVALAGGSAATDPARLRWLLDHHGVCAFQVVPPVLRLLLEHHRLGAVRSLRDVYCGGEHLPLDVRDRFLAECSARLHNVWGVTEATIASTDWPCSSEDPVDAVPIGRPIGAASVHRLDAGFQPCPDDQAGELFIGGVGVARGYVGRPALTAERYVPDPFARAPGSRMYRTGDLARHLPTGGFRLVGRIDDQVKLSGFRIEPAGVEAALRRHPAVADVAVRVVGSEGRERLSAYVVPRGATTAAALRHHAGEHLPPHMVPSTYVFLAELPLTRGGKVDRQRLPDPTDAVERSVTAGARTPAEEILVGLWQQALDVAPIGVFDDFVALGGHSITAATITARINETFGIELAVADLLRASTIDALVRVIAAHVRAQVDELSDEEVAGLIVEPHP